MGSSPQVSLDQAIKTALSSARISTYEAAVGSSSSDLSAVLQLYAWNAQVSAALLAPLHICEVVIRNAVSDAITAVYGPNWPWSGQFVTSLPTSSGPHYNHRRDLLSARQGETSTGKVIPELKFVFWQKMFTGRFDARLWNLHLRTVFPHLDPNGSFTVQELRKQIYDDLEQIRLLRNRIAHHEPIFNRNLLDDFQKVENLVTFRCVTTATWMLSNQQAQALISTSPLLKQTPTASPASLATAS